MSRLSTLLLSSDLDGLLLHLSTLSVAARRHASLELGVVLPRLAPDALWAAAAALVASDAKAHLVTCLKSAAPRMARGELTVGDPAFQTFLHALRTDIDREKTLLTLLPALRSPDDVGTLFHLLGIDDARRRLAILLRVPTTACYFAMLHTLHFLDDDRPLLLRTAAYLMRSPQPYAFNMASLLRAAFDLTELRGTFSLRLQPYELARLHKSYDAFCQRLRQ